jgi:hypothetical protein
MALCWKWTDGIYHGHGLLKDAIMKVNTSIIYVLIICEVEMPYIKDIDVVQNQQN